MTTFRVLPGAATDGTSRFRNPPRTLCCHATRRGASFQPGIRVGTSTSRESTRGRGSLPGHGTPPPQILPGSVSPDFPPAAPPHASPIFLSDFCEKLTAAVIDQVQANFEKVNPQPSTQRDLKLNPKPQSITSNPKTPNPKLRTQNPHP